MSLAEDIAEHQAARKGKAVVMDPSPQEDHASIMVLEEDLAAAAPTRLYELITLNRGVGLDGLCSTCPTQAVQRAIVHRSIASLTYSLQAHWKMWKRQ